MIFRNIQLIVLFFAFIAVSFTANAADDIHVWVDKNGATNITDKPPEKPARIIGRESNKLDSPEDIKRYERKRKTIQRQQDAQRHYYHDRSATVYNTNTDEYRYKDDSKARALAREKADSERLQDLEIERARLRAIENRDYREAHRQHLKAEKLVNQREIEKIEERKSK